MSFLTKTNRVTVVLDDHLQKLLNERLPRGVNLSILLRWFIRGLVMNRKELEKLCWQNQEEASQVGEYLQKSLRAIYDAMPEKGEGGE